MVDDRIRDETIRIIKRELDIVPGQDKCFMVDSVDFSSGAFRIPSRGVEDLQSSVEQLFHSMAHPLLREDFQWKNLAHVFRAAIETAWRNKATLIAALTSTGTVLYQIRSRL